MSTDIALEAPPSTEEMNGSHPPLVLDESPVDKAAKREKKRLKKEEKKRRKLEMKSRVSEKKSEAVAFPMVALIDEQVRTSIPEELVAKVKGVKKKSEIISPNYPYPKRMKSEDYNEEIELLQIELVKMQAWVKETGRAHRHALRGPRRRRQGRHDPALHREPEPARRPRGGAGQAFRQRARPVVFPALHRELPTKGEIVFFDRSWYNRAGVEHVMGFCSPHEYLEFMRQAPEFERMMVRSGIRLFKFWFSVSREEQLRRFLGRAEDPLKQWKLSPMDVESLGRWDSYTKAKEAMLFYTDTADAPWTIVRSDDKNRARLNAIKFVLHSIPYAGKDDVVTAARPDRSSARPSTFTSTARTRSPRRCGIKSPQAKQGAGAVPTLVREALSVEPAVGPASIDNLL